LGRLRDWLDFAFYAPYSILRHIWIQLVLLAAMFGAGTLIFMQYQGLDPLTAFLGSVSTITTIGIYAPNIVTMPSVEKALLVVVFIVSVGSAASLVQGTVAATVKRELITEELARRRVRRMKNHVIVMGYSFLGKYVVSSLKAMGVEFVVVAKDKSLVEPLISAGTLTIIAPVTHAAKSMLEAGVEQATAMIATFDDDGDNMLSILTAKKINPKIRAITIVNDKDLVEAAKRVGADVAIPLQEVMGQLLALSSESQEVAGVFLTDNLRSRHVAEFQVKSDGIRYGQISKIAPVLLISRKGETIYDMKDDFQLQSGDLVYVLTDHESLKAFRKALSELESSD
jgi:voltage-gated potassium channel